MVLKFVKLQIVQIIMVKAIQSLKVIQKYGKTMRYVEFVMGVILIIIGAMLFFGTLETMNRFGLFIDFGL